MRKYYAEVPDWAEEMCILQAIGGICLQTIGERIRYLREARGLSQLDLAARTGLQRGNISHYERNKVKPSAEAIVQLASELGVTSDWLLTGRQAVSLEAGDAGVSERLRDLRLSLGLTAHVLGQQTGLAASDVIAWESGQAWPSGGQLAKLAAFFGVSLDWVITGKAVTGPLPGRDLGENEQAELRLFSEFLRYRQQKTALHRSSEQSDSCNGQGKAYGGLVREAGGPYLPVFSSTPEASPVLPNAVWEGFIPLDIPHPASQYFALRMESGDLQAAGIAAGDLVVVSYQERPAFGEAALVRMGNKTMVGEWHADGRISILAKDGMTTLDSAVNAEPPVLIGRIVRVEKGGSSTHNME